MPKKRSLSTLESRPHATVFPGTHPRTVRLALDAGESVDPHRHPGHDALIYLVRGSLDVSVDDETIDLDAGDVAHVDGDREIAPTAREDSVALVVLSQRPSAD